MQITVSSPIVAGPRVRQIEGLFDLPRREDSTVSWDVHLPLDEKPWHLGLIVGPSGCGKSTIARRLWPGKVERDLNWPTDATIVDAFPEVMPIKEIVEILSSVGLSSPPAWLRPFRVLSTGQQFRVTLARLLAETTDLVVCDEFTSVVDRTVAQVGSHAVQRTVRKRGQQFVAVTCHEDVEAWLNPDWVYRPVENAFTWRLLQRRPAIALEIARVHRSAWRLFKDHHYLNTALHPSAACFGAFWQSRLAAFSAWLPLMTRRGGRREHRTVTLPDYQGVGIGHALSTHAAEYWKSRGFRATSTTSHPAFIAARARDPRWRMTRAPGLAHFERRIRHAGARLTAGFEYVGEQTERDPAGSGSKDGPKTGV